MPNANCPYYNQHPIIAEKLFQFLNKRDIKMFAPLSSTDNISWPLQHIHQNLWQESS